MAQQVPLPLNPAAPSQPRASSPHLNPPGNPGQLSYTGLIFSPDGTRIYYADVTGDIEVFQFDASGKVTGLFSIPLPPANAPGRKEEIPAGLALSPDGGRLYVCGHLSNRLLELNATNGAMLRMWAVNVDRFAAIDC